MHVPLLILICCLLGSGFFILTNPVSGQPDNLVVLNLNKFIDGTKNLNIEGEVRNNSSSTADFVQVIGTFYDSAGRAVGTEYSFTNPSSLTAGNKAPFHIILSKANVPIEQIANYSIAAADIG